MKSEHTNDQALMKLSPESNLNPPRQYYNRNYSYGNSATFTFSKAENGLKQGHKNVK
jgi:hypothetical protein